MFEAEKWTLERLSQATAADLKARGRPLRLAGGRPPATTPTLAPGAALQELGLPTGARRKIMAALHGM